MRKLLIILASASSIALPITSVMACTTSSSVKRFDTPILPKEINDQILMALLSDPSISPEIKGRYFNDIDFNRVATAMLEDRVSKLANNYYQNGINKSLMLDYKGNGFYEQNLDQTIDAIAQNQFYLEYTKNLVSKTETPLDIQINIGGKTLISLNPSKLLQPADIKTVDAMDTNDYYVFYKASSTAAIWNRWEYFNENGDNNPSQIPTITDLESSQFVIIKKILGTTDKDQLDGSLIDSTKLIWLDGETRHDDPAHYVYSLDGKTPYFMNGKTALQYRFQEYFRSQIRYSTDDNKSLAKRMLALSYLESSLFNVYRNENQDPNRPINDEYLNINSDIAQNIQTWNKNVGYQSKLKLVWSFTMNSVTDAQKVWNSLPQNLLNADGSLTNANFTSLKNIYSQIEQAGEVNQSNLGSDPFFSLNGYNGIVKNDKDNIISVDGNLAIDEEAKKLVFEANSPSILSRDGLGSPFKSNINGKYDFVFVMPIYLIDLLNDKTAGYDHGLSSTIYVPKANLSKSLNPDTVFTSFSEAQVNGHKYHTSKVDDINRALKAIPANTHDYYIFDSMGASYTFAQWKLKYGQEYTPDNVWTTLNNDTNANGLQVAIKNSHDEMTFGNIGIGKPVRLMAGGILPENTDDLQFSLSDGYLYVTASNPNFIGQVHSFFINGVEYYLSFDAATKEGVITTTGNVNKTNSTLNGSTYGDRINMGQNSGNPTGYIEDESIPFNYYDENITSLDIANLNTANKTSLLRQIESVIAKDEAVINRASTAIYPLFLKENDILFNPLYESLKKYLINEGGGASD